MAKENYQIYIKCTLYILKEHQGGIYSSLSLWIVMIQYDDRKQWESMSYLYYRTWCRYSAQLQCILVECGPLIDNTFLILMNYFLLVVTWSVILQIIYPNFLFLNTLSWCWQCLQLVSKHGRCDKTSPFCWLFPVRYAIQNSSVCSLSSHLAIWPSGFLKFSSHWRDAWSVLMINFRP